MLQWTLRGHRAWVPRSLTHPHGSLRVDQVHALNGLVEMAEAACRVVDLRKGTKAHRCSLEVALGVDICTYARAP